MMKEKEEEIPFQYKTIVVSFEERKKEGEVFARRLNIMAWMIYVG